MKSPIIICGAPRSGTQFHRRMISTAPNCMITSEINRGLIEKLKALGDEVELYTRRRENRKHSMERQTWWCITFWLSMQVSKNVEVGAVLDKALSGEIVIGNKTPSSEFFLDFYADVFRESPPKIVYCLRSGLENFSSQRSMPWKRKTIERMLDLYVSSVVSVESYAARNPGSVKVVQLDKVGDSVDRGNYVRGVFDFCGLDSSGAATEKFIGSWQPVGSRERIGVSRADGGELLTKKEIAYVMKNKEFRRIQEMYGYEL